MINPAIEVIKPVNKYIINAIQFCTIIYLSSIGTIEGNRNMQGHKTSGMPKVAVLSCFYPLFPSIVIILHRRLRTSIKYKEQIYNNK